MTVRYRRILRYRRLLRTTVSVNVTFFRPDTTQTSSEREGGSSNRECPVIFRVDRDIHMMARKEHCSSQSPHQAHRIPLDKSWIHDYGYMGTHILERHTWHSCQLLWGVVA